MARHRDRDRGKVIAGADGCRAGWVVVVEAGRELSAWLAPTIDAVVERLPAGALLAIDIPIGLPSRGDRRCCIDARRLLKRPRASSVFPVPVRACLPATSYDGAAALHRAADGRGITKQAWAILPKIRQVDTYVRRARAPRVRITEIHPEVSFAQWHGAPMSFGKTTGEGRLEREALIDSAWPGWRSVLWEAIEGDVARDDLYDAFAALWTARRIVAGTAVEMPATPESDAFGLPMRIVR